MCNLGSVFQDMALDSHKPFKEKLEVEITRTTIDYWRVQKKKEITSTNRGTISEDL